MRLLGQGKGMKNYGLVLPKNYVSINETEMEYVDGGLSLSMQISYLNKSYCQYVGNMYAGTSGLSGLEIAKEIYAHAVMYYASPFVLMSYAATIGASLGLVGIVAALGALKYILDHANPVDIGGDSSFRVTVFNAIWYTL